MINEYKVIFKDEKIEDSYVVNSIYTKLPKLKLDSMIKNISNQFSDLNI